ncbi:MAG TPA: sigma-70 family RNA polymerase sigma factor [Kiritimatiellia bacterium]|nr:sigma-70 family RNA polymerase sigma factor [Kiritimatiellia bacterium]HSA17716.1 sigma-70 family RNA polymerase sigma factor [Kiritimatiellia bacterium]
MNAFSTAPDPWRQFFRDYDGLIFFVVRWPKWRFAQPVQEDLGQRIREDVVKAVTPDQPAALIKTLIRRIAVRRCIDEVRRQVSERAVLVPLFEKPEEDQADPLRDAPAGKEWDPRRPILLAETSEMLSKLLGQLGALCQQVIQSFYRDDLAYEEIAAKLALPASTVGVRLFRCLEKARRLIRMNAVFRNFFRSASDLLE